MLSPENLSIERTSREWSGLFDNLIIYGLMGIAFGLFFVFLNHIVEYGFFVLLAVWILGQLKNGTLKWIKTPLDLPILLYVAWVLICVPLAVDPDYSFGEWRKVVAHFLLFYFVVQTVKTKGQILSIFLAGAVGVVVLSAVESFYFLWQGRSMWDKVYRAGDFFGSSQWLSVYLVIGFPMLWMCWDAAKEIGGWGQILFGVGLAVSFLGVFLSHTRGAWVAIGIQVFIYVLLKLRSNWWGAFGGAGLLVCGLLVMLSLPILQNLLDMSSFSNTNTMQVRYNTWSLALQDISENPLTGIGLGKHSFSKVHPELGYPGLGGSGFHAGLHNTLLGRAVQIGIPGFLFFFWIFIVIVARAAPIYQSFSHEIAGKLALATSLIVVGVIVRNIFDDMFIGTLAYLFWLLVGLFFSMEKAVKTQTSIREA